MGVGILRLPHGLDFTEEIRQHNLDDSGNLRIPEAKLLPKVSSCVNLNEEELDSMKHGRYMMLISFRFHLALFSSLH